MPRTGTCERCGEPIEKTRTKRLICNGRAWGIFCYDCHDILAAVALAEWPIAPGAVLYEDRPETPDGERRLHHVVARRVDPDTGEQFVVLMNGPHTTKMHSSVEDVVADFAPAGWQWPVEKKPTAHLMRCCDNGRTDREADATPTTRTVKDDPDATVLVRTYADSARRPGISTGTADHIITALNDGADAVLVCEEWLTEDLVLPAHEERPVFVGRVNSESEKAWEFACGGEVDWIPKSQSTLFILDDDVPGDTVDAPQRGLSDFTEGDR